MERAKRMLVRAGRLDGSRCAAVFDFGEAGLANIDRPLVRTAAQTCSDSELMSVVAGGQLLFLLGHIKKYYPDSFARVYFVGIPWFFHAIWSWVKPMLAKHAQDKAVFIDEGNGLAGLAEYVEPRWLLQRYGGEAVYTPGMDTDEPEPEPESEEEDEEAFYDALPGPVRQEARSLRGAVGEVRRTVRARTLPAGCPTPFALVFWLLDADLFE